MRLNLLSIAAWGPLGGLYLLVTIADHVAAMEAMRTR